MSTPTFRFRIAAPDDAPALVNIYAPYVEQTAISFEYDVPSVDEFRRRMADVSQKYPYLVAEDENGQLLGYAYTHTFIAREAYDHCAESTIYLAPTRASTVSASASTARSRNCRSRRTFTISTPASASRRARAMNI